MKTLIWVFAALVLLTAAGACYVTSMPGRSHSGGLPPLTAEEASIAANLERHVHALAGEIGERNLWRYDRLRAAAVYLDGQLRGLGYQPSRQSYEVDGRSVENLEVSVPGAAPADEIVIAGAHYDSERGTPGADDNASGVAAVLELARWVRTRSFRRTVRLVFFVNEESPFFTTDSMGSRVHARAARKRGERIVAMLSIESIGYYSDTAGSQRYPVFLGRAYPNRGDFIAFVGNLQSRGLVRRVIGSFRSHTAFPSQGIAAPEWIPGVTWSDHWSFWREGYPAVMVTDTVPFRNPNYHRPSDRSDTLDYARMARVVGGLGRVIGDLARG